MYKTHFGLAPRPFGDSTRPDDYVAIDAHEAALRRLRFGLEHARGPALLTGPPGAPGLAGSVRRVGLALRERGRLLVVDEAHLIDDPATLEALRLLLNFDDGGPPDLALLLVGGPDLPLQLPESLADRLTVRARVGPLTRSEASAYVLGRLARAGARMPLFDAPSLADLHRAAEGLPRRINRLADLALLVASAEGLDRVDPRAVEVAARETAFEPIAA